MTGERSIQRDCVDLGIVRSEGRSRGARAPSSHLQPLGVLALFSLLGLSCIPDSLDSSYDFSKQALNFENFDTASAGGEMNTELAVRMFGAEAVCRDAAAATCEANDLAQAWIDSTNQTLAFGHSEGMAALSLLISLGKVDPQPLGGDSAAALSKNNRKVLDELAYWSATQSVPSVHERDKQFTAADVMPFLTQALAKDNKEGWRLTVAIREGTSLREGHGLVPFGFFRGDKDGQYILRLYDSNFPGEERRMLIDTKENVWRYNGSLAGSTRIYEGTKDNGNKLYFSPVVARLGQLKAPWLDGAGLVITTNAPGLSVEGNGNKVGFDADGKLNESGGTLLPISAACRAKSELVQVVINPDAGALPQTVKVQAKDLTDGAKVQVTGGGASVTIDGVRTTTGADSLTVGAGGKSVDYQSGADGPLTITTTVKNADGSTSTVSVTADKGTKGLTIDASDPTKIKVTGDVTQNGTKVTVTVTKTGTDGSSNATSVSGTTSGGNDVAIGVDATTGTTSVDTNVNFEPCMNKKKDANEGDVDCGKACFDRGFSRCTVGQSCLSADDCPPESRTVYQAWPKQSFNVTVPGNCISNVCRQGNCTDGLKNGFETDVDCGGFRHDPTGQLCPTCAKGKACVNTEDCNTNLQCIDGLCSGGVAHRVSVEGLTDNDLIYLSGTVDNAYSAVVATLSPASPTATIVVNSSMHLSISGASSYSCTFTSGPQLWDWTRPTSGMVVPESRTIRCVSTIARLRYTNNDTGCRLHQPVWTGTGVEFPLPDGRVYRWRPDAGVRFNSATVEFSNARGLGTSGFYEQVDMVPVFTLYPGTPYQERISWLSLTALPGNRRVTDLSQNQLPVDGGFAYLVSPLTQTLRGKTIVQVYNLAPTGQYYSKLELTDLPSYEWTCAARQAGEAFDGGLLLATFDCSCTFDDGGVVDAGVPDAGPIDAGRPDAGAPDAGPPDAGRPDAGPPDAGAPDAGAPDAGPQTCTRDSDCASSNCYCGASSGNCTTLGTCGPAPRIFSTPTTDGVANSGTYTVPAGCTEVFVSAWGAAGGGGKDGQMPLPMTTIAGAGGFASGRLSVTAGDIFTVWIGRGGSYAGDSVTNEGLGSYFGTVASGGLGDSSAFAQGGGSGGGLTSVRQRGSASRDFTVPGGAGAAGMSAGPAQPGGGTNAGGNTGIRAGEAALLNSNAGGGGAGEPGGLAGVDQGPGGSAGQPGAFGTLPMGITSTVGTNGNPAASASADYSKCPSNTATGLAIGGTGGNACVVLRCKP